jgi:hypothetical protein
MLVVVVVVVVVHVVLSSPCRNHVKNMSGDVNRSRVSERELSLDVDLVLVKRECGARKNNTPRQRPRGCIGNHSICPILNGGQSQSRVRSQGVAAYVRLP